MGLDRTVTLADGRQLGFDDVGDPEGIPVLYVHGSPDSRRARHPNDRLAAELGVRLVAVAGVVAVGVLLVPREWLSGGGRRPD